jgi:hypothetical protein
MIARSWRATATPDGARRYEEHFHTAVLPELRAVPGFRMAYLMRRADGDGGGDSERHGADPRLDVLGVDGRHHQLRRQHTAGRRRGSRRTGRPIEL